MASSTDPLVAEAAREYRVMTATRYQHRNVETARTFFYDCVGFVSYALGRARPRADATIRTTFAIGAHRVPSPARFVDLFARLDGHQPGWASVPRVADLAPGDVIAWAYDSPRGSRGHAAVIASAPRPAGDDTYLVDVWDSTATPHGPDDTRVGNPRNLPGPNGKPSGLGSGTIRLDADAETGRLIAVHWSPSGPRVAPARYGVARPTA